jgi:T5SS/PEP-CTERM-associated repeat protein
MNIKSIQTAMLLALTTILPLTAAADEIYWNNSDNGDWFDNQNWNPDQLPTESDTVYINNGGTVFITGGIAVSEGGRIGWGAGSDGTVVVGSNALWRLRDELSLGFSGGTAMLIINGTVDAIGGSTYFAEQSGGEGKAVVQGSGYLNAPSDFVVGQKGVGILTLTDSGSFHSQWASIGGNAGGVGTVTISDSAVWNNDSELTVGENGTGTLNLNGGTVRTNTMNLGTASGGAGTLEIGGDGSGKIIKTGGSATQINGGDGGGTVRFTHSGTAIFANGLYDNIILEHDGPGTTILTGDADINCVYVYQGALLIEEGVSISTIYAGFVDTGAVLGGKGGVGHVEVKIGGHLATTLSINTLTLEGGAVLDYLDSALSIWSELNLDDSVLVDFSGTTLEVGGFYVIIDWTHVGSVSLDASQFSVAGTGVEGTFEVQGSQLTFTANAVPEPSTYILIGIGLGALLVGRLRRRNVQS